MLEFFEKLRTIADIQALIDDCEREKEVLEYKRANTKFSDPDKREIGKDVSAMANSSGGLIIYGVGTDQADKTKPVAIEGLFLNIAS